MRILIVFMMCWIAGSLYGQTELQLTAGSAYVMLPSTSVQRPPRAVGSSSRNQPTSEQAPLMVSGGLVATFRGQNRRPPVWTRLEAGALLGADLDNTFTGEGFQGLGIDQRIVPMVARVRLQGASFLQGVVGLELFRVSEGRGFSLNLGLGGNLVVRERVHGVVSWIDENTGRAVVAEAGGYSIDGGALAPNIPIASPGVGPGAVPLTQTMLRRFSGFAELNGVLGYGNSVAVSFGLQVGLNRIIDQEWYNTAPEGDRWIAFKVGAQGKIF